MIQLDFDAATARRGAHDDADVESATASTRAPSARPGATPSSSSSTAPIPSSIRPRARTRTSTARRSTSAAPASEGVGCDDTRGPTLRRPPGRARRSRATRPRRSRAFPWIGFGGRWGELQRAFFNGPTGPEPQDPVDRADPLVGGLARPRASRCPAAARSGRARPTSSAARSRRARTPCGGAVDHPLPALADARRADRPARRSRSPARPGGPSAPFRLARRRAWGQILSASLLACTAERLWLFLGIGILVAADLGDRDRAPGRPHPRARASSGSRPRASAAGSSSGRCSRSAAP